MQNVGSNITFKKEREMVIAFIYFTEEKRNLILKTKISQRNRMIFWYNKISALMAKNKPAKPSPRSQRK